MLAERIADVSRPPQADIQQVTDAVDALLDRSVGAEEYVIRAAAEGIEPDPLSTCHRSTSTRCRPASPGASAVRPTASLRCSKGGHRSRRNPTRFDLVDAKVQAVFDHIVSAYGDDGTSVYRVDEPAVGGAIGAGVAVLARPILTPSPKA